jgi:hypothetical protein
MHAGFETVVGWCLFVIMPMAMIAGIVYLIVH